MSFGYRDRDWVDPDREDRCCECAFFDGDWCYYTQEDAEWDDDACSWFERAECEDDER